MLSSLLNVMQDEPDKALQYGRSKVSRCMYNRWRSVDDFIGRVAEPPRGEGCENCAIVAATMPVLTGAVRRWQGKLDPLEALEDTRVLTLHYPQQTILQLLVPAWMSVLLRVPL